MNNQQLVLRSNQIALTESDQETLSKWRSRQSNLSRFQVTLPTLSEVVDPHCQDYSKILRRLAKFEKDRGGLATTTMKMLSVVLKKWKEFCLKRQIYAFPQLDSSTLELFLMTLVVNDKSIATISQYRSQLLYFFDYLELYNPARSPDIKAIIKSLKEDQVELTGEAYSQEQATPFRLRHLTVLDEHFKSLWPHEIRLSDRKAMAVVSTAYASCLREDEICRIKKKHLIKTSDSSGELAFKLTRTRSKTGVDVKSKWITGSYAVTLNEYLNLVDAALDDDHYVFSNVSQGLIPLTPETPMTGKTVDRIFARLHHLLLSKSQLDIALVGKKPWSGHSARIGRVQDAYQIEKLSFLEIERLGDWKLSTMVKRYLREILEQEELEQFVHNS